MDPNTRAARSAANEAGEAGWVYYNIIGDVITKCDSVTYPPPSLTRFWDASLAEWNDTRYETYDSGELISSVRRYGIWNMIRGSLLGVLDDMRHDSENVLSLFLSISISFCQLSWEPDEIPTHTNARKLQTLVPLFLSILLFLFYLDVGSAPLFLGGYVVVLDGMVWIWSV